MEASFKHAVEDIIQAGKRLDALGLAPATSGNYSVRLLNDEAAITVSGWHKGHLKPQGIMRVDLDGRALDEQKPSAETLLHTSLYKMFPQTNAILHTHSVPCVVLTRLMANADELVLEGYELLKAFPGIDTHDVKVALPVFDNMQDMDALKKDVEAHLTYKQNVSVYLIRGHGLYAWGRDMTEALRVIEAAEVMLSCELEIRKIK